MSLKISNLRLGVLADETELRERAAQALGVATSDLGSFRILRKSLDARHKTDLVFVYSVEVRPAERDLGRFLSRKHPRGGIEVQPYSETPFELPAPGARSLTERPVIIGAGPAGLFAAYFLAEQGYQPLVLERGQPVSERIEAVQQFDRGGPHNSESNYLFGEGGAGTFSDGKLTCRASGPDVQRVLEIFAASKGKPSIVYDHRPHLGSNRLPAVVKALRQKIISLGGTFQFDCLVNDLAIRDRRIVGLQTSQGAIATQIAVLAIGHSARDTYEMLHRQQVSMIPKAFQFGVRIEQPQEQINRFQYGPRPLESLLGSADYSVVARGTIPLFSFCMCAGGYIMPSVSEPGYFSTNGMSLAKRNSPFANSGMMITLEPTDFGSDHPLAGMYLQRRYEQAAFEIGGRDYRCPIQTVEDFLNRRATLVPPECSYPRGVQRAELREVIPPQVAQALEEGLPIIDERWRGRFLQGAHIVGPEARGSSPVRLPRDPVTLQSPDLAGLYPIGEGAGYAGGIVSAALDGLRAARAIIQQFASLSAR